jgi:hypothetical protein
VRFFAHDGQTVHGPSRVEELTSLPNFDGDTLVCPVGSENSADWKPALAYPPFRAVLLAPARKPAPAPPPAATARCPRCAHSNPLKARFCNDCGGRMDGEAQAAAPMTAAATAPVPLPATLPPAALETPPPDPFRLEPMLPAATAPFPEPAPVEVVPDPAPAAPPPAATGAWRKTLLAAFASAALFSSVLGWWLLRPAAKKAAATPDMDLTPPAPSAPAPVAASPASAPIPAPQAPPAAPAAPVAASPLPAATPAPAKPAPAAAPTKPAKPRRAARAPRAKKVKTSAAPKSAPHDPLEDLTAPGTTPEPSQATKDAAPAAKEPAAKPAAPADAAEDGFLLPGVPRRVPPSSKRAPAAKPAADAPGEDDKTGASAAAPAASAPAEAGEDASANQVREQFDFCSQLTTQGAFADYFDTCLCSAARLAAPYKGNRSLYAAAMKTLAESRPSKAPSAVGAITLDGGVAKVKTNKGPETWTLEDGLWCKAP